ncbi:GlxA family transcriptional regulator [Actinokineospora sp. NPDC004072]
MHRIAVLAVDGVVGFELGIPALVFATAVHFIGEPRYAVRVCAPTRAATAEAGRYAIQADCGLDELAAADTLILPARRDFADEPPPGVLAAVDAAADRGARIASICTGAFDLARTGLLDGRRATTHWRFADDLARRHPAVTVDPAVLFVDEGPVLTSAGAAAGIDLCLHLVRRDHGAAFAAEVARVIVAPPQRDGGQAQYLRHPDPADPDRSLRPTLDWLRADLAAPVTVAAIARHAGLSPRALTRRFQAEVGAPPLRWLLRERVRRAQHLLETTDLAVDRVAAESGFATAVTLRHHFTRVVGTSPQSYRRTFRA